jgi:hypothetical protein
MIPAKTTRCRPDYIANQFAVLFVLAIFLLLYLLSPYLVFSDLLIHTGLVSLLVLFASNWRSIYLVLRLRVMLAFAGSLLIFLWYTTFVSLFYEPLNRELLKLLASVFAYVAAGGVVGVALHKSGLEWRAAYYLIMRVTLVVVVLNSAIIVIEFFSPPFKGFVEGLLAEATNIDYSAHEFRLRGIASGGGASLSMFHGLGIVIAVALYQQQQLRLLSLLVAVALASLALVFIGRTGFIVAAAGVFILAGRGMFSYRQSARTWFAMIVMSITLLIGLTLVSATVPPGVLHYSLGMLFGGMEEVRAEGTVDHLISWYVLDPSIAALLFGVGDFSGSFVSGESKDAGYLKMITALGVPLAALYYLTLAGFFSQLVRIAPDKWLTALVIVLLFFAEVKEPLLIQGYSARMIWLMVGAGMLFAHLENRDIRAINCGRHVGSVGSL